MGEAPAHPSYIHLCASCINKTKNMCYAVCVNSFLFVAK